MAKCSNVLDFCWWDASSHSRYAPSCFQFRWCWALRSRWGLQPWNLCDLEEGLLLFRRILKIIKIGFRRPCWALCPCGLRRFLTINAHVLHDVKAVSMIFCCCWRISSAQEDSTILICLILGLTEVFNHEKRLIIMSLPIFRWYDF